MRMMMMMMWVCVWQEMEIAVQANERQLAELQRRHAADRKQLSKQQKKEWRSRRQAFCDQIEMRRAGIISEQDRIRLRQVRPSRILNCVNDGPVFKVS